MDWITSYDYYYETALPSHVLPLGSLCPTDEKPWPGHSADQQPGGAAAQGPRQPLRVQQKDDCTQHPAPAPLLPLRRQNSDY